MIWAQGWFWQDFLAWWLSAPGLDAALRRSLRRLVRIGQRVEAVMSAYGTTIAALGPPLAALARALPPAMPPWQSRPGPGG